MKSRKSLSPIRVAANFLLALIVTFAVTTIGQVEFAIDINPLAVFAPVFALGFVPGLMPAAAAMAGVITEAWIADIEENLFNDSEFVNMSVNDDDEANNGIVHVPQAGSEPVVEKNRTVFPATASQRTDTVLDYNLDSYTTDPIFVRRLEEVQTSYQKRQSVLGEHVARLSQEIGDQTAVNWAPTGSALTVLRTTGAGTATLPPGATGTRNRVTKQDISRLALKLDKDRVAKQGRFLLMQTEMYYELFEINELTNKDFVDRTAIPNGVINILYGFNIMVRDTVVLYDSLAAGNKKAVGAAPAITDSFGCIAWSQFRVRKAVESIQVFEEERSPLFFGDILSAELIMGSSKSRTDDKGIVALAQGS